jgi:uncharacterized protein (TIGR00251 family)
VSSWLQRYPDRVILALRVQPRASRDEVAGIHGDRLKVRICAPPVDGAANRHLCRYLADLFDVPAASVRLIRGESGRDKTVEVTGARVLPGPLATLAHETGAADGS